jgi:hypothetical protein
MDPDKADPSQPGQTPPAQVFLHKNPQVFRNSQTYPSTLEVSLQFSPFFLYFNPESFQTFAEWTLHLP